MAVVLGNRQSFARAQMRRVVWSEEAKDDLVEIRKYVEAFSVAAGRRLAIKLVALAESLDDSPERGRVVRAGVRELTTIRPYVVRYVILADEVRILTVRHSARRPL